jgi:hypothetical protein
MSQEARLKMSQAKKGYIPWNKGKKGLYIPSAETRRKMSKAAKGRRFSDEHRKKISEANKGQIPWHKGKTGVYSEETLKKMSEWQRGRTISEEVIAKQRGKNHWNWKGGISPLKKQIRKLFSIVYGVPMYLLVMILPVKNAIEEVEISMLITLYHCQIFYN